MLKMSSTIFKAILFGIIIVLNINLSHGETCGVSYGGPEVVCLVDGFNNPRQIFWDTKLKKALFVEGDNNFCLLDITTRDVCCQKVPGYDPVNSIFSYGKVDNDKFMGIGIAHKQLQFFSLNTTMTANKCPTDLKSSIFFPLGNGIGTSGTTHQKGSIFYGYIENQKGYLSEYVPNKWGLQYLNYFKHISELDLNIDGNKLYVTDNVLNGVFMYDFPGNTLKNGKKLFGTTYFAGLSGIICGAVSTDTTKIWISLCNDGLLIQYDAATSRVLSYIPMPVCNSTSLAFGGDNLDILLMASNHRDDGAICAIFGTNTKGYPKSPVLA